MNKILIGLIIAGTSTVAYAIGKSRGIEWAKKEVMKVVDSIGNMNINSAEEVEIVKNED